MAYVQARGKNYTGYFRDAQGRRRSAGTYTTSAEALIRAQDLEGTTVVDRASVNPSAVLDRTYADYAWEWLENEREIGDQTKRGYESNFRAHVLPYIGHLTVGQVTKKVLVDMLTSMEVAGVSAHVRSQCRATVGRSFRPLVPDVLPVNPAHRIKVHLPPSAPFPLVQVEDFQKIVACLPHAGAKLFATFLVTSGARFGEAAEVRVKDLNFRSNEVSLLRRISQLGGKRNNGVRYAIVQGTKAGKSRGRTVILPPSVMADMEHWVKVNHLGHEDLVFPNRLMTPSAYTIDSHDVEGAPFTRGEHTYHHGTAYGYSGGGCRCDLCRNALRKYRRELARRRQVDRGVEYGRNTTGHLAHDQWRGVWRKAIEASGLGWFPRTHDLRHACATHLVASGISIFEVKEIMGHHYIETTLKYQHRVAAQQSKATEALSAFTQKEDGE